MDIEATPIRLSVGNIVKSKAGVHAGVVMEIDHEHARRGGFMIYRVVLLDGGAIVGDFWFAYNELDLLDDGSLTPQGLSSGK